MGTRIPYSILVGDLFIATEPIVSSFHVLMPPTSINCLIDLRKLGLISSPFSILYECAKW